METQIIIDGPRAGLAGRPCTIRAIYPYAITDHGLGFLWCLSSRRCIRHWVPNPGRTARIGLLRALRLDALSQIQRHSSSPPKGQDGKVAIFRRNTDTLCVPYNCIVACILGFPRLDSGQPAARSRHEGDTNRVPSVDRNFLIEWMSDGQQDTAHTETLIAMQAKLFQPRLNTKSYIYLRELG